MGCGSYFAASRLEVLLDEDDSRSSSRVQVFCLFHNCMWQSRHSEVNVYFLALSEQTDGLFTFNGSPRACLICVYVFVCVFVFIYTFSTDTGTQLETSLPVLFIGAFEAKLFTFFDFLSTRTGWLLTLKKVSLFLQLDFWFLVGFVGSLHHLQQLLNPILSSTCFSRNLWKKSKWRIYFLVYDFSNFHHDSLRDTISWKCVVKDDCVRSCLIELNSFLLSKSDVDPIHRVLMFSSTFFLLVPCKTWCFQVNCIKIFVFCSQDSQPCPEYVMECKLIAHLTW